MNIKPNIWGPCAWDFFYFTALSYPKLPSIDEKNKYKNFYIMAGSVIPCEKCRYNFKKHLSELPIDDYLDSSYNLFTWITKMENKVRKINNKKEISVDENFEKYMSKINDNTSINLTNKEKILIFLICAGFLLYLLKKIKNK